MLFTRHFFFATWPGLTYVAADKYLNKSIATTKDHLRQTQKGVRSTQNSNTLVYNDYLPKEGKTRETYIKIKPAGTIYTD